MKTGDEIELDVEGRTLSLCVSEGELARRKLEWKAPDFGWTRGYHALFAKHVTQAHQGCDFDFLAGQSPGCEPPIF